MGLHLRRPTPCDEAGRSISLRLDDELSELEEVALDRHLAGCGDCRALAAETAVFTRLLREEPLVELARPVALASPGRSRTRLVRRTVAGVAIAASLATAAGVTVFSGSEPEYPSAALTFRSLHEQHQFVRAELIRLESQTVYVVDTAPRFTGRGLL